MSVARAIGSGVPVHRRPVVDEQRCAAQSQLESELKRSLTSTEALIFERGFVAGSLHGSRASRKG